MLCSCYDNLSVVYLCTAPKAEKPTDKELLENELQSLSRNTTSIGDSADSKDDTVVVENRAFRPTSGGRRYSGNGNTTNSDTGNGRWRARGRLRPGAYGKLQKGGRQRGRNRGRKFRGRGRNRMRIGQGSGRRLKSGNRTAVAESDREQSDAAYKSPSMGGGSTSVEGREEMTNTLEPVGDHKGKEVAGGRARSCYEMRCRRGGYCVVVEERQGTPSARCQCPLGTKGHQCEKGPYSAMRPSVCLSLCLLRKVSFG